MGPSDPPPGRSVFDDPPAEPPGGSQPPATGSSSVFPAYGDAAVPAHQGEPVGPPAPPDARPADRPPAGDTAIEWVVDDGWVDDVEEPPRGPRSPWPWVVAAVFGVLVLVVGALVVRAVNTDAELGDPSAVGADDGTGDAGSGDAGDDGASGDAIVPTVDMALGLVPDEAGDCTPAPEQPDVGARVVCTRSTAPDVLTFTLFPDRDVLDTAFGDAVDTLELDGRAEAECALAAPGVHAYETASGSGRVACRLAGDRVDFVWTSTTHPLLGTAAGVGFSGPQYAVWSTLAGRTDDAFPLPAEQELLDALPAELVGDCRRDHDLARLAPGVAAVACDTPGEEADVLSWVRFGDGASMQAWIDARRASLPPSVTEAESFGAGPYDLDGATGQVLSFVNTSQQNVLFWTRDDSGIGSIAVSEADSSSLADLRAWWEAGGHLPA